MKLIKYVYCFLVIIFFSSCEKEINVDLPVHQPKLTIDCHLTSGDIPQAFVSHSLHSLSPSSNFNALPDAEVLLYENGTLVDTLLHSMDITEENWYNYDVGVFIGDYIIQPDKIYKIQANHKDYETAFGETICPKNSLEISEIDVSGLKIDSVQSYMEPELDIYEFYRTGQVKFKLSGKLDKELHYYLSIRDEQGELAAFDIISNDPIIVAEESNFSEGEMYAMESLYFSGSGLELNTTLTIKINPDGAWRYEKDISDGIEIRIEVLNDDYFQFINKVSEYDLSLYNPFVEMVFIPSNIEGGYGFVSGTFNYTKISN